MRQQNFLSNSNLLMLTVPTASVAIITLLLSRGNFGIAIGTGITCLLSSKAVGRNDTEIAVLRDRFNRIQNAEDLVVNLPSLQAESETLVTRQNELRNSIQDQEEELSNFHSKLHNTQGELAQKQGKLTAIERDLTSLSEKKDELEQKIAFINQKNPDLAVRDRLYSETEELRLQKTSLDAQVNALKSQQTTLETVKLELATKQPELEQLRQQLVTLQSQTQGLQQQATELELLRVTYDALSLEKDNFETRIDRLRPEISGLEAQKQQILQAIRENESEYRRVEQRRAELQRLNFEIDGKYAELQNIKQKVAQIQGVIASLAEDEARLKAEIIKSEKHLKQLKGEIEEIENSAKLALQALRKPLWLSGPQTNRQIDTTPAGEKEFISGFTKYLTDCGLTFSSRVINAFHTSLKVQDISALVILAGISGTGKSELPQRYADYIGAQKLTLAVQPRWDSPQDLQGFYNYIEKKYKPTDLMRGLYQYQNNSKLRDRLVIVLLDEMNLARVEYYFSDFLSKLETRRSGATYLELDVGSLPLPEEKRRLEIPQQFLFVGTMNEDETTQSLSDKVLDRANVLTFGKPQQLKLREEAGDRGSVTSIRDYVSYSQFQGWMRSPVPHSETVKKLRDYLDRANAIMDKLGHPFAHRVYQAITRYVVNYPGVAEGNVNEAPFKAALADQFGQKLLPKLRGLMLDECHEQLEEFSRLINDIGDPALIKAFAIARDGHFGQFQWRGFVYLEESEPSLSPVEV